jgi:hypothetical protein
MMRRLKEMCTTSVPYERSWLWLGNPSEMGVRRWNG